MIYLVGYVLITMVLYTLMIAYGEPFDPLVFAIIAMFWPFFIPVVLFLLFAVFLLIPHKIGIEIRNRRLKK